MFSPMIVLGQDIYKDNIEAAEDGNAKAQYNIGMCFENGYGVDPDYSKAVYWYRKAAEQGNADALYSFGKCYEKGYGISKDFSEAINLYHKAAEQGVVKAKTSLGVCYKNGNGVEQDFPQAVYWFKQAAEKEDAEAQFHLGVCYELGQGVDQDYSQAVYWYSKSAEQGNALAQNSLGTRYYFGQGVEQDYSKAIYWFRASANQWNYDAKNNLKMAEQKLKEQKMLAKTQPKQDIPQQQQHSKDQQKGQQHLSSVLSSNAVAVDIDIPKSQKRDENTYAVVIGNEKYKNESDVPYALNDARVFYQYVTKTLGVPENQVQLKENASLNEIKQCVKWLTMAMDASSGNGKIIFYYAGHGIPDEATQSSYLLPVDGMGSDVEYAYSLESLYSELSKMPSDRIMVFLDACFSGAKRNGQLMNSARGVAIKAKASRPKGNMIVFSAAQGDETAYPYDDCQHGMFTYFLLKKIQETEGNVTLGDLSEFITKSVKMQSSRNNEKKQVQTPTVNVSPALKKAWMKLQLKQ